MPTSSPDPIAENAWRVTGDETARVERGIVIVLSALRLGTLVQLVIVAYATWRQWPSPWVWMGVMALVIAFSSAYVVASLRRGNLLARSWGVADVLIGCTALVALTATAGTLQVGSWVHWAPGYLDSVAAFVPAWIKSRRASLALGLLIGLLYAACAGPGNDAELVSVIVNATSYPLFSTAGAVFASYARSLAADSDRNRQLAHHSQAEAIRAEAALELARYSFHVHNATGLLEAFAKDDLDPRLLPSLRRQAAQEANRLRYQVLRGQQAPPTDEGPQRLEAIIWDATEGFGHLPLEFSITLGRNAMVAHRHALALKAALVALLYNVQLHARAPTVTIHADELDGEWEVTLTDDGVGFNLDPARFGFGLDQVVGSLEKNGLIVTMNSRPGEGTTTTMKGPVASD